MLMRRIMKNCLPEIVNLPYGLLLAWFLSRFSARLVSHFDRFSLVFSVIGRRGM